MGLQRLRPVIGCVSRGLHLSPCLRGGPRAADRRSHERVPRPPWPRPALAQLHAQSTGGPGRLVGTCWPTAEPVAHAFLFRLKAWFGGMEVQVGGVATVGVAPEARRKGHGTALLTRVHEVARARGDAATVLYPFRQAFYSRFGYATTSPYRRLRLHPASIPGAASFEPVAPMGRTTLALAGVLERRGPAAFGDVAPHGSHVG